MSAQPGRSACFARPLRSQAVPCSHLPGQLWPTSFSPSIDIPQGKPVMTGLSAYTVTPRQTRKFITRCMISGLVPFIQSSPAMGKSAIVAAVAREYGLQLIDHRLSTSAPEDLSGLPRFREDGIATFAPFDTFPTDDMPIPEGKQGWLLFLDEFNSASKMVQAAAY